MLEVDKNTFQTEVLEADGYVFVDFFGDGCVPCAALMPKVHEFADTYGDKLKFTSLNTTKARRLAIDHRFDCLRCTIILHKLIYFLSIFVDSHNRKAKNLLTNCQTTCFCCVKRKEKNNYGYS